MKNIILDKIKKRKAFELNDIFIYLFLLLTIFLLFLFFVIIPQRSQSKGFKVLIDNEEVLSLYYENQEFTYSEDLVDFIEIDKDKCQITIFYNLEKSDYNTIKYNTLNNSVVMVDSTCSSSKDCIYEPAISKQGVIYCAPHNLIVIPITNVSQSSPPIIGGGYD